MKTIKTFRLRGNSVSLRSLDDIKFFIEVNGMTFEFSDLKLADSVFEYQVERWIGL